MWIETYGEWCQKHGGNPIQLGNERLFPSGARCFGYDDRAEPPPNEHQRLTMQRRYWAEKVRIAETDFAACKKAALACDSYRWRRDAEYAHEHDLPRDIIDALKLLQAAVLERRAKLAEIDTALSQTPEAIAAKEREERMRLDAEQREREDRARHDAYLKAVNSIVI